MEALDAEIQVSEDNLSYKDETAAQNDAVLKVIILLSTTCFFCLFLWLFSRYNLNELNFLFARADINPPTVQFVGPQQAVVPTRNPFRLSINETAASSGEYSVSCQIACESTCVLRAYWGVKIKEAYPSLYLEWQEYCGDFLTNSLLDEVSLSTGSDVICEPCDEREIIFSCPDSIDLGAPPRDRYPLVVVLMDANYMDMLESVPQIASVFTMFHLSDAVCPGSSHIISQFVRVPHGQPFDLKRLFVNEGENTSEQTGGEEPRGGQTREPGVPAEPPSEPQDSSSEVDSGRIRDSTAECAVCLTAPVQIVLLPCRHACVCRICFTKLSNCPMCRYYIISFFMLDSVEDISEEEWNVDDWDS